MKIRLAEKGDYKKIGDLIVESYEIQPGPASSASERRKKLRDIDRLSKTSTILVATDLGQEIIGVVAFDTSEKLAYPEFPKNSAYLRQIVVDRNYRRKGIGSALVMKAMEFAKAEGRSSMILRTSSTCWKLRSYMKPLVSREDQD